MGLRSREIAARLRGSTSTRKVWRQDGLLKAHALSDKHEHLFAPPGADGSTRYKWKGLS